MQRIYLDHNATTPVHPEVLEAMLPYFGAEFGNPSSVHQFGQQAGHAIEQARESVAALIGARSSEIVFTSGGTEADNAAIFGIIGRALRGQERSSAAPPHLITTVIEHDAVLSSCRALEGRGVSVTYVPVDARGIVSPDAIRAAIRPETALISVMYANNEIGALQPIDEIAHIAQVNKTEKTPKVAAEARIPLHTDAVQAAGKIAIDVNRLGVQLLSLSAHKFCGPKGAGALFVRKGVEIDPLLYGGPNERRRRAGTENVAGIVGLGKAAELARRDLAETSARMAGLRDRLEKGLLAAIPGARVNGDPARRIPNTCNLLLPGTESESLLIALDLAGLACSAGAACSSGAVDPSHVLTAIGLTPAEARASVRLSVGRGTTSDEIDRALELIPAAVARQRSVSKPGEMAAAQ
jgi:cysteine desulfurase